MRERAIREGSVGLLILLAIGLFAGLVLWLKGLTPGRQSYRVKFVFENTLGMQEGTAVTFRGVRVGRVLSIRPESNQVTVTVEIIQPDLKIPSDSRIEVNQSGLIGDTTLDITPVRSLSAPELALTPFRPDCQSQVIICDGDQLSGQVGASFGSLIQSTQGLASAFADPSIMGGIKTTLSNATQLTENGKLLTQADIGPLLASANRTSEKIGNAATAFELTGTEVNSLIAANRSNLISSLEHVNRSTANLEVIMATLAPAIQNSQFLDNLDALSADATVAMADIRAITSTVNTPANLVTLQQTLDSARTVFQGAHKVLADVDELTGDPQLRRHIRDLINGLSTLVSATQQLEQEGQLAQTLTLPQGAVIDRITLTPEVLPRSPGPDLSGSQPLLITHNGQPYSLTVHPKPSRRSP
jgi:phospholipid/cholesterol/gamma-HCH transport system substrate-binding protein